MQRNFLRIRKPPSGQGMHAGTRTTVRLETSVANSAAHGGNELSDMQTRLYNVRAFQIPLSLLLAGSSGREPRSRPNRIGRHSNRLRLSGDTVLYYLVDVQNNVASLATVHIVVQQGVE
jgi:hypothetical protein